MKKEFLSFTEAKKYVHKLGIKTKREWYEWSKTKRPDYIPSTPNQTYRKYWLCWEDWLINKNGDPFLSFEEAIKYVHKLGIKTKREWNVWSKTHRPSNIPSRPDKTYKNEWVCWGDWLGNKKVVSFLPFEDARKIVSKLGLKNYNEWYEWSKTKRPDNIPPMPHVVYKKSFRGYNHWLGKTSNFLPFNEAREFVHKLGLKGIREWSKWSKTKRPSNIPSEPKLIYKNEWVSIEDWLGYERKKFLPFEEARDIVRKLGLKTCLDWKQWCKAHRPINIPSQPYETYKNEWVSWNDWFGK
jgi:hypothetical protein